MKRNKSFIAGVICAILCAFCVFAYTGSVKANAEAERAETLERFGGDQVEVYVATRNISAGEVVDARSAETRLWIADLLPKGSVHDLATVAGKKATAAIYEGEVITEFRFDTASSNLTVPEGFVAVSVPAQEVNAVGGAVAVGSRINIYAAGAAATELIGENILVLATSSLASESLTGSSADWITIAVLPESVQEIVAATQSTKLYFSLPSLSLSRLGSATMVAAEPLDPLSLSPDQEDVCGEGISSEAGAISPSEEDLAFDTSCVEEGLEEPVSEEAPAEDGYLEVQGEAEMQTDTEENVLEMPPDDSLMDTPADGQMYEDAGYEDASTTDTW